jgi:hypothetical protein
LQGARKSYRQYKIFVPQGASQLWVATGGGKGDVGLFVQAGGPAGFSSRDQSQNHGSVQTVTIRRPRSGWYYVLVYGNDDYRGVDLAVRAQ